MRARIAGGAAVVVLGGAGAAIVFAPAGSGEDGAAAASATPTTTVVRRDLVEVQTEDGTLGYSDSRAVVNRLSGTVTWLPRKGSVAHTNGRLFEVDGKTVYLLDGAVVTYRPLAPGTEGDDVRALERNLRALGYDTGAAMTVDETWDAGTTAAVDGFERGGWAPPYADSVMGSAMADAIAESGALLLGRRTYEHFASVWPHQPEDNPYTTVINNFRKYVASTTGEVVARASALPVN